VSVAPTWYRCVGCKRVAVRRTWLCAWWFDCKNDKCPRQIVRHGGGYRPIPWQRQRALQTAYDLGGIAAARALIQTWYPNAPISDWPNGAGVPD
jgi:hypothetical protein